LETVVQKSVDKVERKIKMDVDKWSNIIPICVGSKNVAEFINTCEIAIREVVTSADKPLLLKIINSKLAGNALEACKYRETDTWESIKSILQEACLIQIDKSLKSTLNNLNPGIYTKLYQ